MRLLLNARIARTCLVVAAVLFAVPVSAADTPQLGPRPFYLVDAMKPSPLKEKLASCKAGPFRQTDFSIAHRGAPLQFPEHTRESYVAAARMGAGVQECDVTFTKDRQLVCRHSQCDLHTTTDILARPELAAKCSKPFTPANAAAGKKAEAMCCTSDITLAEFKTLNGKMDAANENATTVAEYLDGTASWRTDLYATKGTLLTHRESIQLFKSLGAKFTPELKNASVKMPYEGNYTQANYAQQMIDEYKAEGVDPSQVFAQSFSYADILYWLDKEPAFGKQAVFLDDRYETLTGFDFQKPETWKPSMDEVAKAGVKYIAPPLWMLLTLDEKKAIVPSVYAKQAAAAGLGIITWTLERSGPLAKGGGWYFQSIKDATNNDGVYFEALDVLAQQVKVKGVFSDWPATTTYYASCMGMK